MLYVNGSDGSCRVTWTSRVPRYWLVWLARVQRCLSAAGCRHSDQRALIEMEENVMMQVGGHKLTAGERLARPHRPAAWTEALQRLTQLPPTIATRSRAILRKWQRTGYTLTAVGMMLRDVLMDCTLEPLEAAAEKKAERRQKFSRRSKTT